MKRASAVLAVAVLGLLVTELRQEEAALTATPLTIITPPAARTAAGSAMPSRSAAPRPAALPTPSAEVPAATSSASAPTPPAPEGPPAVRPPRPGRWDYTWSSGSNEQHAGALTVSRAGKTDRQTWNAAGDSSSQEHIWSATALRTTSSGACQFSPAETTLVLPLRPGAHWTSTTRCRSDDGSVTTTTTRSVVKGWTKVHLDDAKVAVWVIDRTVDTVVHDSRSHATASGHLVDLFSPALGLTVVQTVRMSYPDGQTVDAARRMLSTTPR